MNFEEFYEEVIATLGGTLVDIELEEADIRMCYRKAKRKFLQEGNTGYRRLYAPLCVNRSTRQFVLSSSPKVDTIVRIVKPRSSTIYSGDPDMNLVLYDQLMYTHTGRIDLLTYELTLQLGETINRYAADEIEFEYDKFRDTITIFTTPRQTGTWFAECYVELEDEEYYQIEWIMKWATAEAKEMLGQAYRKFSSLSGPTGEVQLAGTELISEAKEEKTLLIENMHDYTDGSPYFSEIRFG